MTHGVALGVVPAGRSRVVLDAPCRWPRAGAHPGWPGKSSIQHRFLGRVCDRIQACPVHPGQIAQLGLDVFDLFGFPHPSGFGHSVLPLWCAIRSDRPFVHRDTIAMRLLIMSLVGASSLVLCCPAAAADPEGQPEAVDRYTSMSLQELLEITLTTASRIEEKSGDIPASVKVITRAEIDAFGYTSLEDLLSHVLGVYTTSERSVFGGHTVGVRGYWSQVPTHFMILVNGVPVRNEKWKNYALNEIRVPVEAIDRIEIVRGPMAVIYGDGAFFGVANIVTTEKSGDSSGGGRVSFQYGTRNSWRAFARVSTGAPTTPDGPELSMNASIDGQQGSDLAYEDFMSNPGEYKSKTVGTDAFAQNGKYVDVHVAYKGVYSDVTHVQANVGDIYFVPPWPGNRQEQRIHATRASVGYKASLFDVVQLDSRVGYSESYVENDFIFVDKDEYSVSNDTMKTWNAAVNLSASPIRGLNGVAGAYLWSNFQNVQHGDIPSIAYANYRNLLKPGDTAAGVAGYMQLTWQPIEVIKLVGGVRLQRDFGYEIENKLEQATEHERIYNGNAPASPVIVMPRAAVVYTPTRDHSIKLLYGRAIRQPAVFENADIVFFNGDNALVGDRSVPFLHAESIDTFEVNYLAAIDPRLAINVSAFYNRVSDILTRRSQVVEGRWQPLTTNYGALHTIGGELDISVRPRPGFNVDLGLSYQNSQDEGNKDLSAPFSPPLLGYLKALYTFEPLDPENDKFRIRIAMAGRFVDQMAAHFDNSPKDPNASPDSSDYEPVGRTGENAPAYIRLDANARVDEFFLKGMYLNAHVNNLLGAKYRFPNSDATRWADKGIPADGFELLATLGYGF